MKAGMAAGRIFTRGEHRHRVVIGKDTRPVGLHDRKRPGLGLHRRGHGRVPVRSAAAHPAVAFLTRSLRADMGVMITASHNPFEDNGIKFFGPDGQKLSDEVGDGNREPDGAGLEQGLASGRPRSAAPSASMTARRAISNSPSAPFRAICRLDGMRIVIDCANGAAYKVAPAVLWELGADIVTLGVTPDGTNINLDCGSTAPQAMCAKVRESARRFRHRAGWRRRPRGDGRRKGACH